MLKDMIKGILTCPVPGIFSIYGMLDIVYTTSGHFSVVFPSPIYLAMSFVACSMSYGFYDRI